MWWLWVLVLFAVMVVLVLVLNRRGPGDPAYRPDDPRSGEQSGNPGGDWGPGDGSGF